MIYILILFLLLFLSFKFDYLGQKRNKELWFVLIGVLLVCLAGFRYRIGVDSIRYETKYGLVPILSNLTYDDIFDSSLKAEPLFVLLFSAAKTISDDFWVLQMLQSILVIAIFWRFIKKNTQYWFISAFLFTLILYLHFTCEILRESCAVSMFLLGWEFYKEKKWIKYYISVICAICFHSGAVFLLVIPILDLLRIPKIIEKGPLAIGMLIITLIGFGIWIQSNFEDYFIQLLAFSSSLSDKADSYSDGRLAGQILNLNGLIITIINDVAYPIMAIFIIKKKNICHPSIKTMLFLALVISILQIPVALLYRFCNYFLPFVIIALSEAIFTGNKKKVNQKTVLKKDYASCIMILVPYIVIQLYSYRAQVGNTRYRMYEIYTPYTSIFDKSESPERNAIYRYYGAE